MKENKTKKERIISSLFIKYNFVTVKKNCNPAKAPPAVVTEVSI